MHKLTLKQLADGLAHGDYSSVELTEHFLKRISEYDTTINSFITVNTQAIEQAKLADRQRADNKAYPLTGVPIAQKDIFCTKDMRTSCGSKMLDNFISPYDATLIEKCHQSGLVMLGKTNMDEFAMGSSNENSFYGAVKNPWDLKRVPGGSSGGSAAAVAARLAPAATGTDTGGSIRQPAAFCGLTGLKPTYGRVSRYGMIAFASSLDQGGPMTQTAEDAALLMNVITGFDPKDSTSIQRDDEDFTRDLNRSLKGLKIGLPVQYFNQDLNPYIASTIEEAAKQLEKQGATLKKVQLPNCNMSIPVYYVVAVAECSSNLARYDGVRYGYRCENPKDLLDLYKRSRSEGFGDEVKRRIMLGTYALSSGYYDAYYLKAQKVRHKISEEFQTVFKDVDCILGPTTPHTAFNIGEKINDPISMYLSDMYTTSANLAGLPAINLPAGFSQNLPVGMQLIGNYFTEAKLLNIGHQYQQVTHWHQQLPEGF
jgi:aspartyl-tRNA(Asn)/glutamyl-tRNA(Gln) amidotransferase subunit A